jgi:hypothetical protein
MAGYTKLYYLPIEHSFIPKETPADSSLEEMPAVYKFIQKQIDLKEAVNRFNQIVQERDGIILADGQILLRRFSISDVKDYGINAIDIPDTQEFSPREWDAKQKEYFGIKNPYQLSEDNEIYSYGWILIDSHEEYLEQGERILAMLHGEKDERPFYCNCHNAQVVYTSTSRFVCMMCGMLHCVLEKALSRSFRYSMTAEKWFEYFDEDGTKKEEEIDLDIVDFQDIENLPKIWVTDQYEEASRELIFFSRSTPEELEAYWKTTATPETLIEAGFSVVHQPPEPIFQIAGFKYEVDKLTNALSSLEESVFSYQKGRTQTAYLKSAILQIFHALELLLKARLEELDPTALTNNPNNPTVVKLLQQKGVTFNDEERKTIAALRKLRNLLQHAEASFNYRTALSLLQKTFIFIDRLCIDELKIWIAEQIKEDAWQVILPIASIQSNAQRLTAEIIEQVENDSECEVSSCSRCKAEALVSRSNGGSICIYCRHRPTLDDLEADSTDT